MKEKREHSRSTWSIFKKNSESKELFLSLSSISNHHIVELNWSKWKETFISQPKKKWFQSNKNTKITLKFFECSILYEFFHFAWIVHSVYVWDDLEKSRKRRNNLFLANSNEIKSYQIKSSWIKSKHQFYKKKSSKTGILYHWRLFHKPDLVDLWQYTAIQLTEINLKCAVKTYGIF